MRVAMLAYAFYESDNRVRRYAETLSRRGDIVDVISLRRKGETEYNELNGVRIFRIQERTRNEKSKLTYLLRIISFLFRSFFVLSRKHIDNPYDIIHVHSVPDFEIFAAIIPKLTGAKIIIDIHDIVPELYAAKFKVRKKSIVFFALLLVEKLSIALSDHVIISNEIWRKKICSRSVKPTKCTSIINYPDENIFRSKNTRKNGKFIFLYPGTLNYHQGVDIAINAFYLIKDKIKNAELHIVGDGPHRESLISLIRKLDIENCVRIFPPVSLDEIANIIANSNVGVVPKRNDDFGGDAFSTKTLEFMISGVPIIVSKTRIDQYYYNDNIVKFFSPENVKDLARAMESLALGSQLRERIRENALNFVVENCWSKKSEIYIKIINNLLR